MDSTQLYMIDLVSKLTVTLILFLIAAVFVTMMFAYEMFEKGKLLKSFVKSLVISIVLLLTLILIPSKDVLKKHFEEKQTAKTSKDKSNE